MCAASCVNRSSLLEPLNVLRRTNSIFQNGIDFKTRSQSPGLNACGQKTTAVFSLLQRTCYRPATNRGIPKAPPQKFGFKKARQRAMRTTPEIFLDDLTFG